MTTVCDWHKLLLVRCNASRPKVGSMALTSNESEPFITAKEAAAHTGYSLNSIYGMVHRGEIPFHRRGKGVGLRFRRSELDSWMKGEDGPREGVA